MNYLQKGLQSLANGGTSGKNGSLNMPVEDIAAIRIQTAFRAYIVCQIIIYVYKGIEVYYPRFVLFCWLIILLQVCVLFLVYVLHFLWIFRN